MQFREVAWSQQLYYQRLIHGPGAEITERSLPNYPGSAMREIIRQSEHPQNLEPILLTLRRPANTITRRRFAEVGGELVLIQKVTSSSPVATDFKMAVHGQIVDAPDGILYPIKASNTPYEAWLRAEMLDILRLMIEENLVRSLLPQMQLKLISDMWQLVEDPEQHELVQLYSFAVAVAALKRFHAARAAAIKAGFPAKAAAFLAHVLDGPHPAGSIYSADPFEQLKALTAAVEALYLIAASNSKGDYNLAAGSSTSTSKGQDAAASAATARSNLDGIERTMEGLSALQQHGAADLVSRAVEKLWQLLQARDNFAHTPPAKRNGSSTASTNGNSHTPAANGCDSNGKQEEGSKQQQEEAEAEKPNANGNSEEEETEEQKQMRAAAEEAVALSEMSFEENWQLFLKSVYDTDLVPLCATAGVQLGAGLLQMLAHTRKGGEAVALPSAEVLQQLSSYNKHPLLAATGSILAAASEAESSAAQGACAAILSMPGHEDIEFSVLAKSCFACNKPEGREVKLLRCSQCGLVYYCTAACQKSDWKLGHKGVCKDLAAWRAAIES